MDKSSFLPLVLGGLIAAASGIIQFEYSQKRNQQKQRALLRVFLVHQIRQVSRILQKLIETYNKTNVVYLIYLQELLATRVGYDRNSDWIVLYSEELRQKIVDYFNTEQTARVLLGVLVPMLTQQGIDAKTLEGARDEIKKQIQILSQLQTSSESLVAELNR